MAGAAFGAELVIVDACIRAGAGGSPTGVVDDDPEATDADRRSVASRTGTSHVAFVGRTPCDDGSLAVRFFTSECELSGCGHGTVAAQAVLLERTGTDQLRGRQRTGGRVFDTLAVRRAGGIEVWFDQGVIDLRAPTDDETGSVLPALGLRPGDLDPDDGPVVASPGTARLLVPVADPALLPAIRPRFDRLAAESRRLGLLGCFVHASSGRDRPVAARMFAPAIGVNEDVANANSTGCLAAHLLLARGTPLIEVEQGDSLARPSTVFASATASALGVHARIGALAVVHG